MSYLLLPAARIDPWVDWGKALASQCIVWHHLAHYGPLAARFRPVMPRTLDWLDQRALWAVQVFLVMAGYLAARSLWPQPGQPRLTLRQWPAKLAHRWRRLMPLYLAALALAVLCAALARLWMDDADTPAAPALDQLLAHLLMAQDVVGQPALSAGVWYVAIDLQLFALLAALAGLTALAGGRPAAVAAPWRGRLRVRPLHQPAPQPVQGAGAWRQAACGMVLVGGLALASLLAFNLDADGDMWATYFFGAYALGVLAAWGGRSDHRLGWAVLIVLLATAALWLQWRDRLLLASLVALALLWRPGARQLAASTVQPLVAWLARVSYALFLVHYPVSLAMNAAFEHFLPAHAWLAGLGLLLTWLTSLMLAWGLTQLFEPRPAGARQPVRPARAAHAAGA